MTIHATWPTSVLTAGTGERAGRTISGMAVPWDVPGRVSDGTTVVFHAGSLTFDADGPPLPALRDHDRTRPIGRVTAATDTPAGLLADVAVSRTPDGNDALVLAGDGALGALSVGADPTEYRWDSDGTLHVDSARWLELSLLTIGAYADARVSTVTASPGGSMLLTASDTPPEEEVPPAEPDGDNGESDDDETEPAATVEAGAVAVPLTAGRPSGRRPAVHPYAGVTLHELARVIQAAAHSYDHRLLLERITSSPGAIAMHPSVIEAALVDVKLVGTDNVGAMYRPAYQAELVDIVSHGTPAIDSIRSGSLERGDFPNKTFNQWTKTPQVALQSAEKVAVNSTAVAIATVQVPVKTFATANDVSRQILDFGSPSFIEDYVRAAGVDYAYETNLYVSTALLAAATAATAVAGDNLVDLIPKMLATLDPTKVPAGDFFVLASYDLAVGAMGILGPADTPVFWTGTIDFGGMLPDANMGGITVKVDTSLPAKTALLGQRNAATWYTSPGTPYSVQAVNVGLMGLDVGIIGYGAIGVQYPGALVKATVPAA